MAITVDWTQFTDMQRAAISGFIRHGNKLKAYTDAYTCENQLPQTIKRSCYRFFVLPKVKAIVNQVQEEAIKRANIRMEEVIDGSMASLVEAATEEEVLVIDAYWVLKRAAALADFNIYSFIRKDDKGNAIYDFSDATAEDWYCIQEYTVEEVSRGQGSDRYLVDRLKIKSFDKLRALELVGKHVEVQAFKENIDHNHSGEIKHRTLNDFYSDIDASSKPES